MADVTGTPVATPATPAAPVAAVATTLGQSIDAEIVVLKSRIAAVEASAKTDWSKAIAWAKSNWAHIALTYPAAATILAPVVKDLLKAL